MIAAEARNIATSVKTEVNAIELKKVEGWIERAAKRGELKTYYYESISNPVVEELKRRGFGVETVFDIRDGITVIINW